MANGPGLKQLIEYIVGAKWNNELTTFISDNIDDTHLYHHLSSVNWTREFNKLNCDIIKCYGDYISKHPGITLELIRANPNIPWNWTEISKHPNITWNIIQANPEYLSDWVWYSLSINPNITWDIFQKTPGCNWDTDDVSQNPNITWDIIQENSDYLWDWDSISRHPNITWDIIQANPDKLWNWECISENPNITWDIIQANPNKQWNMRGVSENPNITFDIIRDNHSCSWNWCALSRNPNITFDIIKTYAREIHYHSLIDSKFTAQAKISMTIHRITASRITNYLARYIAIAPYNITLILVSLEYGY